MKLLLSYWTWIYKYVQLNYNCIIITLYWWTHLRYTTKLCSSFDRLLVNFSTYSRCKGRRENACWARIRRWRLLLMMMICIRRSRRLWLLLWLLLRLCSSIIIAAVYHRWIHDENFDEVLGGWRDKSASMQWSRSIPFFFVTTARAVIRTTSFQQQQKTPFLVAGWQHTRKRRFSKCTRRTRVRKHSNTNYARTHIKRFTFTSTCVCAVVWTVEWGLLGRALKIRLCACVFIKQRTVFEHR